MSLTINRLDVPNQQMETLLEPFQLTSSLKLQNRMVMAPMTRCFADNDHVPTEIMAEYYGKRGDFGLIISEATMIDPEASGYPNTPGIFSEPQRLGWKRVCDKVHQKGAKFFIQLWHAGMMSHPNYRNGKQPISASNTLPKRDVIPRTKGELKYQEAKPMGPQEMQEIKQSFLQAAINALNAGCDGIELHAANGYLLDSFLHYDSNTRKDAYGGNPENMSRFPLEIVDQLIQAIGAEKIGIRLSPVPVPSMHNMEEDPRDRQVFAYLLSQLQQRGIAYVHASTDHDVNECGHLNAPVSHFLKQHFKGTVIGCGSYTPEAAAKSLQLACFDLIAFGKLSIANPNLVDLVRTQKPVIPFESSMLSTL